MLLQNSLLCVIPPYMIHLKSEEQFLSQYFQYLTAHYCSQVCLQYFSFNPLRAKFVYIYMSLLYAARNHFTCIQTTKDVYIRPVAVSSAAVGIISEQSRAHINVQNLQLQQPRKNVPATKGVFEKVTGK